MPKAPGTKETLKYWYGPYVAPPGWDANRVDLNIPVPEGMVLSIEPSLRMTDTMEEPSHQVAHIHHAHWFTANPGSETDNYFGGFADWMFGNGDEETKADFQERSAAEKNGPVYGSHIDATEPGPVIYMLHNKTASAFVAYIALDITFIHGSQEQLEAIDGREYHDITGVLFGRTFDVPRDPASKDATFEQPEDDPKGYIEWTSPVDGTLIGTGSHVHPGGERVISENYGSEESPCPDVGNGYGGTVLLKSDVINHNGVRFSEDYQTEVTNPAWRAPIHEGDRIRLAGIYENKKHAWHTAMTHGGFYIDESQPPQGRCKPYMVGKEAKKAEALRKQGKKPKPWWNGVPNRPWSHNHTDSVCGEQYGAEPCEKPAKEYSPGIATNEVQIINFIYQPGDLSLSGQAGQPVQVKQGTSLRFINVDQAANIRHSVTTCKWPCNGRYVANYPHSDGVWDSDTLGYDPIDGGTPNPIAETPKDMKIGQVRVLLPDPPVDAWRLRGHPVSRRLGTTLAVAAGLLALAGPATASAAERITAVPQSKYATTDVSIEQGESLSFMNLDVLNHDVTASDKSGGEPLFSTPLIGPGQEVPVAGADELGPGSYGFVCSVHPNMEGTLKVAGGGGDAGGKGPKIELDVLDSKVSEVVKSGILRVEMTVDQPAGMTLSASAKVGKKSAKLGNASHDFPEGGSHLMEVKLSKAAKSALKGADKAKVSVSAEAETASGKTSTAKAGETLR